MCVLGFSVWNDSVRRRSRGWLCWRRICRLIRRRWQSCAAAWEKLKGHDSKLDENSRSSADRSDMLHFLLHTSVTFRKKLCFQSRLHICDCVVILCLLWLQLKVLDGEKEQREREVVELQTRLSLEEQREEERGKEVFTLKQKLTEAETARGSLKKEVRMEESEKTLFASLLCHCVIISHSFVFQCSFLWLKSACWSLSRAGGAAKENWPLSCRRRVAARRRCRMKPRTWPCVLRWLRTLLLSPACSWARPRADWPPQRQSWPGPRPGRGTWSFVWAAFSRHWRERWVSEQAAGEAGGEALGGAPHHLPLCHATTAFRPCAARCPLLKVSSFNSATHYSDIYSDIKDSSVTRKRILI